MYLAYFEQIVGKHIIDLGGPADWALPFWDYSDATNVDARKLPRAFSTPANGTNGLWLSGRSTAQIPANYVTLDALNTIPYLGDGIQSPLGFGGPRTVFSHSGGTHGRLESRPHDLVHVAIGGAMGDPRTAALDPIFWLHHANIDRLWQVWLNRAGGRRNPTWSGQTFNFHDKDGRVVTMAPKNVEDTTRILTGYTYQDVPTAVAVRESLEAIEQESIQEPFEVIAATNKKSKLTSEKMVVSLKLQPPSQKENSFKAVNEAVGNTSRKETYLHFENVTGKGVPPIYDVYVNMPNSKNKASYYAGSLGFFGVEEASIPSAHHAGSGQHFALDISNLIGELRNRPDWNPDKLDVHLEPSSPLKKDASVVIGKISLYSA